MGNTPYHFLKMSLLIPAGGEALDQTRLHTCADRVTVNRAAWLWSQA